MTLSWCSRLSSELVACVAAIPQTSFLKTLQCNSGSVSHTTAFISRHSSICPRLYQYLHVLIG